MRISIYQPKNPMFRVNPDQRLYDKEKYHKVYEMGLTKEQEEQSYKDVNVLLEEIFKIFNVSRPEDFKGHSLSVEDIVEIKGDVEEFEKDREQFICDVFGWRRVSWK